MYGLAAGLFPLSDQDEGTYVYGGAQLVKEKLETEKNDGFIEYRVHCPKCDRILSNSIMDGSELSLTCGKCKSPIHIFALQGSVCVVTENTVNTQAVSCLVARFHAYGKRLEHRS